MYPSCPTSAYAKLSLLNARLGLIASLIAVTAQRNCLQEIARLLTTSLCEKRRTEGYNREMLKGCRVFRRLRLD